MAPTCSLHHIPSPAPTPTTVPCWHLSGAAPCRNSHNYVDQSLSETMVSSLTGTSASPGPLPAP